ncbi:hypothetical protein ABTY63_15000 [Streptomyces solisilvae]|uniref:hypothetical protein n=1 Tax=Streptomyces malaysiensis TaxID=92644 RepID=UPI00331829D3
MEIVYTNRRPGEKRVHIEIDAEEAAGLAALGATHIYRLRVLLEEADRRLNPSTDQLTTSSPIETDQETHTP